MDYMTEEGVKEVIKKADANNDGEMSKKEFKTLLISYADETGL